MKNSTQLQRYKKLLRFLEEEFKSNIDAKEVENISFYSYRNINRIFLALQHETIGNYVKRKKLEKAAEYLKYSNHTIFDIALKVGYADIASFSKAFKKHFNCSPSSFRNSNDIKNEITQRIIEEEASTSSKKLNFKEETLPEFEMLYLNFKGNYDDIKGINKTWNQLLKYAFKKKIFTNDTIIFAEILDDDEICETIQCRYNAGIVLEENHNLTPEGLFDIKTVASQKYVKFIHKGSYESSIETYDLIYSRWMTDVKLEFADKPTLEFYLNDEDNTPIEELLTEIYIPVE